MDNKFSNMTKEEIVAMLKERDGQDYRGGRLDLSGCDLSWVLSERIINVCSILEENIIISFYKLRFHDLSKHI